MLVELIEALRLSIDVAGRAQLADEHRQCGVGWLCRLPGIDRSRFYRWRRDRDQATRRLAADAYLADLIVQIHTEYGEPTVPRG